MENKNQLDHFFRQGLEDREGTPPSASWAQMEALLDAQQTAAPEKKRRAAIWIRWAAVLLPILFLSGWFLLKPIGSQQELAAGKGSESQVADPVVAIPAPKIKPGQHFFVLPGDIDEYTLQPKPSKETAASNNRAAQINKRPDVKNLASNSLTQDEKPGTLPVQKSPEVSFEEPKLATIEPPSPPSSSEEKAAPAPSDDTEIASIEFRSSGRSGFDDGAEIASVEWKKSPQANRGGVRGTIDKIRNGQLNEIPLVADARENFLALFHRKN
jgi:hypothetical protein